MQLIDLLYQPSRLVIGVNTVFKLFIGYLVAGELLQLVTKILQLVVEELIRRLGNHARGGNLEQEALLPLALKKCSPTGQDVHRNIAAVAQHNAVKVIGLVGKILKNGAGEAAAFRGEHGVRRAAVGCGGCTNADGTDPRRVQQLKGNMAAYDSELRLTLGVPFGKLLFPYFCIK